MIKYFLSVSVFFLSLGFAQAQNQTSISSHPIQKGFGVNIHFTIPRPGELKMIADAGFKWIRMDITWSEIEKEKGVYDFSEYDILLNGLNQFNLKAILILDYGNKYYDNGMAPHSPEAIEAFTKWATAAVRRYAGNDILWEMWNEPNGMWEPKDDVDAYIRLALATGKSIKKVAPTEVYMGPATSGVPLWFLEACFKAGLLKYWDAVSLHPYRSERGDPETVSINYHQVRQLISRYAPSGKTIPIISSEWGYSSAWIEYGYTPEKQGRNLARSFLMNLSEDIPVSIFYDWHDDGVDADSTKPIDANHFGTVENRYYPNREPVYNPKPAYLAAKTLINTLEGYHFDKKIPTNNKDHYILSFRKGKKIRLVAWTTQQSETFLLTTFKGRFKVYDYVGKKLPNIKGDKNGLNITLTNEPQYFIPFK
ncbi:MAG: cellulase family glycosylhydrolase [Ginsengibacter sp.]